MKGFKKRLFVIFFLVVTIPIILIVAFGTMILTYQSSSIQETYNVESDTVQVIANPMKLMSRMTSDTYRQLGKTCKESPDKMTDAVYLDTLNRTLETNYSFLAVKIDNEFSFIGNQAIFDTVKDNLPSSALTLSGQNYENGLYIGGTDSNSYLVKLHNFSCTNGAKGIAYIVTDVNNILPQIRMTAIQSVLAFAMIILITALILIIWLYRSIISPLNVLTEATKKMRTGDLNFSISSDSDDELGQLCEDFEEMRIHLKELIDAQLQSEKDTKELISNISHDLKTPITSIKGYAEGLLDGVADTPEKQEKYIKTIYNKAAVMATLVDELSFYAKIDTNAIPYNFKNIDVDDYFADCSEELSLDMELKNVTLKYSNDCLPHTRMVADPEQIKRVINNIIGNALKYMNTPEGEIELRLKQIGSFVQIEIADNGVGISAEDLPNIFDRFYRTDSSRNSKQGGTGLGLAIAKKIIDDHGGQIWALSEAGHGTTLIFTVPQYVDPQAENEEIAVIEDIPKKSVRLFGRTKERRSTSEEDTDN